MRFKPKTNARVKKFLRKQKEKLAAKLLRQEYSYKPQVPRTSGNILFSSLYDLVNSRRTTRNRAMKYGVSI